MEEWQCKHISVTLYLLIMSIYVIALGKYCVSYYVKWRVVRLIYIKKWKYHYSNMVLLKSFKIVAWSQFRIARMSRCVVSHCLVSHCLQPIVSHYVVSHYIVSHCLVSHYVVTLYCVTLRWVTLRCVTLCFVILCAVILSCVPLYCIMIK